jgi:hypothetical protein
VAFSQTQVANTQHNQASLTTKMVKGHDNNTNWNHQILPSVTSVIGSTPLVGKQNIIDALSSRFLHFNTNLTVKTFLV